jgi:cathepsin L
MMTVAQQLALLCALCHPTSALGSRNEGTKDPTELTSFEAFVSKYGRAYRAHNKEYEMRRNLYESRLAGVQQHNSKPDRLWSATVNHLSDRTETELSQLRGLRMVKAARKRPGTISAHKGQFLSQIRSAVLPDVKDWTHLKAAQLDMDQGGCGSCWAVATATMLQANAEIAGYNRSFAAQELVNCVQNPHHCGGSGGCDGATVELGMNWVMESGLETVTNTPYLGVDGTCKKQGNSSLIAIAQGGHETLEEMTAIGFHGPKSQLSPGLSLGLLGWERLPENEYEPLIRAVAEHGPVAVSVGASGWNSYGAGIFDGCGVDAEIDHAVVLMGYGFDADRNQKFWSIKNSWGQSWGENGIIRLLREDGNVHCGTDYQPKVGTACDNGPSTVPVCGMCGILYDNVVPHFRKSM